MGIHATCTETLTANAPHCAFAVQQIRSLDSRRNGFGAEWPWYELLIRPHAEVFAGPPGLFVDSLYQQRPPERTDLEVIERAVRWLDQNAAPTRISINTHPESLTRKSFVDTVIALQQQLSVSGHSLCLELIEFGDCREKLLLIANAQKLRSAGVVVALDDFGSRINCFDLCAAGIVDTLKIDMSVVSRLHRDANQRAIVESITTLGRGLNATVIAEGVESSDERETLKALGVDYAQGFHFHKPEIAEI